MMENQYTKQAQEAFQIAKKTAEKFKHPYVGTEHLLWGLKKVYTGVAGQVMAQNQLDEEQMNYYAGKLQDMGAKNVLVSMAGDGAVLFTENKKVYKIGVAKGQVVNSVGAGDSMVAGFVASYFKDRNYEKALKYATAAGGATAFLEELATKEKTEELLKQL